MLCDKRTNTYAITSKHHYLLLLLFSHLLQIQIVTIILALIPQIIPPPNETPSSNQNIIILKFLPLFTSLTSCDKCKVLGNRCQLIVRTTLMYRQSSLKFGSLPTIFGKKVFVVFCFFLSKK